MWEDEKTASAASVVRSISQRGIGTTEKGGSGWKKRIAMEASTACLLNSPSIAPCWTAFLPCRRPVVSSCNVYASLRVQ